MNTSNTDANIPDTTIVDQFKLKVKSYLSVDDEIKTYELKIKELKRNKKTLTTDIIGFMGTHNIEDLTTDNGNLKRNITHVKKPLNKLIIKTTLMEYLKNSQQTDNIIKLLDNREKEEHISLKRISKKNTV